MDSNSPSGENGFQEFKNKLKLGRIAKQQSKKEIKPIEDWGVIVSSGGYFVSAEVVISVRDRVRSREERAIRSLKLDDDELDWDLSQMNLIESRYLDVPFKVCKRRYFRLRDDQMKQLEQMSDAWFRKVVVALRLKLEEASKFKGQAPDGDWVSLMFASSYLAVMAAPDEVFSVFKVSRDCILDIILLSSQFEKLSWLEFSMSLHSVMRRWSLEDFFSADVAASLVDNFAGQAPQSVEKFKGLGAYILEIVGIAVVSRVLGISGGIMDFSSIKTLVAAPVVKMASNMVDYLMAIIKVLWSGDYSDFLVKVSSMVKGSRRDVVLQCQTELEELMMPELVKGSEKHRIKVSLALTKCEMAIAESKKLDLKHDVLVLMAICVKVRAIFDDVCSFREMRKPRKEALMFFNTSGPSTGKSLFTTFALNGLCRAYGVPPEDSYLVNHFWAYEKYQENFGPQHMMITMDEYLSLSLEVDENACSMSNALLTFVSANPTSVAMAFEGRKGTMTTSNLRLVQVNSNASVDDLKHVYKRGGEAFYRRCYVVDMIINPNSHLRGVDGRLYLENVPVEQLSPQFLNDNFTIRLTRYFKDGSRKDCRMTPFQLSNFVYGDMVKRQSGSYAKISSKIEGYLAWRPDEGEYKPPDMNDVVSKAEFGFPATEDAGGSSFKGQAPGDVTYYFFAAFYWSIVFAFFASVIVYIASGIFMVIHFFSNWRNYGFNYAVACYAPYWMTAFAIQCWMWLGTLFFPWRVMLAFIAIMYDLQGWIKIGYLIGYFEGVRDGALGMIGYYETGEVPEPMGVVFNVAYHVRRARVRVLELVNLVRLRPVGREEANSREYHSDSTDSLSGFGGQSPSDGTELRNIVVAHNLHDSAMAVGSLFFLLSLFSLFWIYPALFFVTVLWFSTMLLVSCNKYFAVFVWTYFPFAKTTIAAQAVVGFSSIFVWDNYDFLNVKVKLQYKRIQEILRSKYFVSIAAIATVGVMFVGSRKFLTEDRPESFKGQGFTMPKVVSEEAKVGVDEKVVDFLHNKIKVKEFDRSANVIRPLIPSGGGMSASVVTKIRHNYLKVNVLSVNGVEVSNALDYSAYGIRIDGFCAVIDHIAPPDLKNLVVQMECPFTRKQGQILELNDGDFYRNGEDLFLACLFPAGVQSLRKVMDVSRVPKKGDRIYCLSVDDRCDKEGIVTDVGIQRYETKYGRRKTPGFAVKWDDGLDTVAGDCKRIGLIVSGAQYAFGGYLVAGAHPGNPGVSLFSFGPEGGYQKLLSEIAPRAIAQGLSLIDSDLVYEEPPFNIVRKMPANGMFAYSHTASLAGGSIIGSSPAQGPPPPSSLRESPFKEATEDFLLRECPGVNYEPAVLSTTIRYDDQLGCNRFVSPFEVGMNRTGYDYGKFSAKHLREILSGFKELLFPHVRDLDFLSLSDALESFGMFGRVDPNKGANEVDPGKKGAFLFEAQPENGSEPYRFSDERMTAAVEERLLQYASGLIIPSFSKSILKDELLPKEKIESVATRVFELQGYRFYLMDRMVNGPPLDLLLRAMRDWGSRIGINASSSEWGEIHKVIEEIVLNGGFALEADFSKFDKRFQFILHWMIKEIKFWFFMQCYKKNVESVLGSVVLARIVGGVLISNIVVFRLSDGAWIWMYVGNLTGHFSTTDENTFENLLLWICLIMHCCPHLTFRDIVKTIFRGFNLFGDDQLVALPQSVLAYVNMTKIVEVMAMFGQKITGVGYSKEAVRNSSSLTFLKRGFYRKDGRVFAPLALSSLMKSLLYYEPSGDYSADRFRHFTVLRTAWEESLFYENDLKQKVRDFIMMLKKRMNDYAHKEFPSDEELLARWDSGSMKVWELTF